MSKILTVEEYLKGHSVKSFEMLEAIIDGKINWTQALDFLENSHIEYAKLHVQAALEAAASSKLAFKSKTLMRQEILSAYPLTNIK